MNIQICHVGWSTDALGSATQSPVLNRLNPLTHHDINTPQNTHHMAIHVHLAHPCHCKQEVHISPWRWNHDCSSQKLPG